MTKPERGDWLDKYEESGQTFKQYVRSHPVTPQGTRNTIYIQPIGHFPKFRLKILNETAEYMELHFGVPVRIQKIIPQTEIPASAQRQHPEWGDKQVLTTHILDNMLKPNLPEDAAAFIAFTSFDLWPGRGWNFVFGEASLRERVGVWSMYRNGSPYGPPENYRLCLHRTIKTAIHETGHMFSMDHCIAYECGMCGSNHRKESDRRPLYFCPECAAKVCWATKSDPIERYKKLAEFCDKVGFREEQAFFLKSVKRLQQAKAPPEGSQ